MDRKLDGQQVADRLWEHRDAAGWNQEELARRSGVSATSITKLENARIEHPRLNTVRKLARAFGVSAERFMEGSQEDAPLAPRPAAERLRSLSPGELRTLAVGLWPEWTVEEDDTLGTRQEAKRIAGELGMEPEQIRTALEQASPLAVRRLRESQAKLDQAIAKLTGELRNAG